MVVDAGWRGGCGSDESLERRRRFWHSILDGRVRKLGGVWTPNESIDVTLAERCVRGEAETVLDGVRRRDRTGAETE